MSPTQGAVSSPSTTSTTFKRGTGLKKCQPATRSGRLQSAAMAVTERDEVLEARMQSSETMDSSSANSRFLASNSSTIASTTMAAFAISSRPSTMASRPIAASAASSVMPPFSAALCSIRAMKADASSAAPPRVSWSRTESPPAAAIWAMPRPMVPVPITPRERSGD